MDTRLGSDPESLNKMIDRARAKLKPGMHLGMHRELSLNVSSRSRLKKVSSITIYVVH